MLILQSTVFCLLGLEISNLHMELELSDLLQRSVVSEISVAATLDNLLVYSSLSVSCFFFKLVVRYVCKLQRVCSPIMRTVTSFFCPLLGVATALSDPSTACPCRPLPGSCFYTARCSFWKQKFIVLQHIWKWLSAQNSTKLVLGSAAQRPRGIGEGR